MRRTALWLAPLFAIACLARPVAASDDVFQRTYTLASGGAFELQNVNGSVVIGAWDRAEVEIHAVKTARRPEDLQRVNIEVTANPAAISVQTRYPKDEGVEVAVEYRIRVPRHAVLGHVATVNGTVRITGVEGSGDLQSVNGDVEALDCAGRFRAHTTNGNVRLELRNLEGPGAVVAETVNGSVFLALPDGAGGDLDVRSLNGGFRSELPLAVSGSFGARQFHGRLGAGGAPIRISTVNGSVRIVVLRATV